MLRLTSMKPMMTFAKHKAKLLKDPMFRAVYEAYNVECELVESLIQKRLKKKMSQAALAKKLGIEPSIISKMESGETDPTMSLLQRVAIALGERLKVTM